MAPSEAGIKRLKEKLKASTEPRPIKSPAKIVEPEREMPGKRAADWNKPIIRAVL